MRRVLPSITTHGMTGSSWKDKINEIIPLNLKEVALFVTKLDREERAECYAMLEVIQHTHDFSIPFVHAVSTMDDAEFRYLSDTFGTEKFNLHTRKCYPLQHALTADTLSKIYIENTITKCPLTAEDLEGFAGICFDLSHLEDSRRNLTACYEAMVELARTFPVGANHISAVSDSIVEHKKDVNYFSTHVSTNPMEFRYLAALSPHAISELCAVELENSLAEQVKLIDAIRGALAQSEKPQTDRPAAVQQAA